MNTIHKFTVVRIGEVFVIETHKSAQPLTMQRQGEQLVFWLRVDTAAPTVRMRFIVVGTGHHIGPDALYIATVQDPGTGFVWHLFQL